jgi:hypothetical protein
VILLIIRIERRPAFQFLEPWFYCDANYSPTNAIDVTLLK